MTDTTTTESTAEEVLDELNTWLEQNWDPDLTVSQWWERLGLSGWSAPTLGRDAYGRGVARSVAVEIQNEIAAFGAVGAPLGLGLMLAAPTIADHGTPSQIERYVRDIVTGQCAWCQLFSEPGAGSDLAGLAARAVRDGDEWIVNGQKVWTSLGATADMAMLIVRSDPDKPKHRGITYFAIDMRQSGVEVRPLREMTGHSMFNETFLTDALVPNDAIIGDLNDGWRVANTTLTHERASLGSGGGASAGSVMPGALAGNLDKRVGDFVRAPQAAKPKKEKKQHSAAQLLMDLAKGNGTNQNPEIRQGLMRLHTLGELGRYNSERVKAERSAGRELPGMGNIAKLSMSAIMRLQRDVGLEVVGAQGMLHGYDPESTAVISEATGNPFLAGVTGMALYAQGPAIYGGTDQIQRNIIGERVLGLPREPGPDKNTPFSELPRNV